MPLRPRPRKGALTLTSQFSSELSATPWVLESTAARQSEKANNKREQTETQTMKNRTAIIALALALPAGFANAEPPEGRPPAPPSEDRQRPPIPPGEPGRGER